jgi:hypothetical protein
MPGYVAKTGGFVNTFLLKRSKNINPHAGSKAADEHLKNQAPQAASLTAFD